MASDVPFRYIAISNESVCPEPIPSRIRRLIDLGVPSIQIRDKQIPDCTRANWIKQLPTARDTTLLMNGRADFTECYHLDGVHVPSRGLSARCVNNITSGSVIIGRSTHTREEVINAETLGADYITFGPVYPTESKPELSSNEIPGVRQLKKVCKLASIPVFALGGITTPGKIEECLENGAFGTAGIRALFGTKTPGDHWNDIQPIIRGEKS